MKMGVMYKRKNTLIAKEIEQLIEVKPFKLQHNGILGLSR